MNLSRLRLITFDVTNTLLQFRSSPGKQYGEIGAMYGVLCDNRHLSANFKVHWHKMNQDHPNFGFQSGLGWEQWWKQVVVGTFKDSRLDLDDKKLEAIATHLIDVYQTSTCWQQCFGALGLLSYIRNRGVPMGIISNFDPRLHDTLVNTKLRHYFKFVIASYEAGIRKPDPEIFTKALKASKISDIKPEECLHIGDDMINDYQGAKTSGWNSVLINDTDLQKLKEKHSDLEGKNHFSSLYDFHKHLLENSGQILTAQSF